MNNIQVILVDKDDFPIGIAEKMEAHEKGLLHRAFSIFIFNKEGEMLLQQRATNKYHSGGLWTNACCSHPQPGEQTLESASRRLREEMGFEAPLEKVFDFSYTVSFENGLCENEFDHVYVGTYEGAINFNKEEVQNYTYRNIDDIRSSLKTSPEKYTAWFHIIFPKIENWWSRKYRQEIV